MILWGYQCQEKLRFFLWTMVQFYEHFVPLVEIKNKHLSMSEHESYQGS